TRDLNLGKVALYQLSYVRKIGSSSAVSASFQRVKTLYEKMPKHQIQKLRSGSQPLFPRRAPRIGAESGAD
ncbi:hypothetical protein, partial [Glutamicibacter creatinolyticus]|uniref:hypothetical protein n=1 Tax=Glutamicibacter creatinolyticus TaxID=162496 RepID=UPI003216B3FD